MEDHRMDLDVASGQGAEAEAAERAVPDRLIVRDYLRDVDIGAFRSERGVRQRVLFNVTLEVGRGTAGRTDDVDEVLSYETIVEAIDHALAAERLNLLETLAERVAAGCLADPRALRVHLRIEKLDRIPGALGVEIVRDRVPQGVTRVHPVPHPRAEAAVRPVVLFLGPECVGRAAREPWLDALAVARRPVVLCLGPLAPQPPALSEGTLRVGLLAIEAHVWTIADGEQRLTVAATRAELDWALKSGRRPIWAPAKMVIDALPRPSVDASQPEALAAWLARELGADALLIAGSSAVPEVRPAALRHIRRPVELLD